MNGSYDIDFTAKAVSYSPMENLFNTRSAASSLFQVHCPKLKLCVQNFWFRSTRLANLAPSYVDITDIGSLKKGLLRWFGNYFILCFEEDVTCTWQMHCECVQYNCRNLIRNLPNSKSSQRVDELSRIYRGILINNNIIIIIIIIIGT